MTKEKSSNQKEKLEKSVQQPAKQPANQQQPQPGGNKTLLIIILIIVFLLIILGVGGYFGYKYWKNKTAQKSTTTSSSQSMTDEQKKLEDLFKYPGSTVIKSEKDNSVENTIKMEMETSDDVTTVYNYYLGIASLQKWGLGSREVSRGAVSAYLNIQGKIFTANLNMIMEDNGKTKIEISFQTGSFTQSQDFDYGTYPNSSTTSAPTGTTPTNSYIISDSNTRIISESELVNLTPWQLKVARNEIYARHGRPFVHKDLQCYFATQSWYKEDTSFTESELSTIDNKNIATILNYEKKINSSYLNYDSGCHTS